MPTRGHGTRDLRDGITPGDGSLLKLDEPSHHPVFVGMVEQLVPTELLRHGAGGTNRLDGGQRRRPELGVAILTDGDTNPVARVQAQMTTHLNWHRHLTVARQFDKELTHLGPHVRRTSCKWSPLQYVVMLLFRNRRVRNNVALHPRGA